MAEITAGMVKALREKTDAPMMECKKALAEAGGDMGKAEEILRVKLGNRATKAAGRIAAEGVVAAHVTPDGRTGALVEVNCETDFVAKNSEFVALADAVAEVVASRNPRDVEALARLPLKGQTVEETRKELAGKIGENLAIRRFTRMPAKGKLVVYIHGGARVGSIVDVVGGDEALGRDLAMHVAASKPIALAGSEVPSELVQKERAIAAAKAAESGKPASIVEKMVEGSVQKFLKEVTLLGQPFVKNDKQTVEQLLKSKSASVSGFAYYVVGEGIEKRRDDAAPGQAG
ncbi:MAG: translation elongation factor Ts [Burkholderiales bacterium]